MSLRTVFERVRYGMRTLLRRRAAEQDLDDELRHHLELEMERNRRAGMSQSAARRAALLAFGPAERFREEARAARGTRWLEETWLDVRYGLRALRKSSAYSAVVVLTLGVGIAGSTTVFSVLNPYLLRPLPFAAADRIVQVGQVDPIHGYDGARFSPAMIADWRARTRAFDQLAAYYYGSRSLTGGDAPERLMMAFVTTELFDVLGTPAALGRTIRPGDGDDNVVVLSHGLWTRRYAAAADILGSTVHIDGVPHSVIGIMPPAFNFPWNEIRLWVPARYAGDTPRDATSSIIIGRLRDGWSAEEARDDLLRVQHELSALHPDVDGRYQGVSVKPLREALNFAWPVVSAGFVMLLAAVTALLLIACINVATLSLARASTRTREVGVRLALGAGRARVARQLMTENLLLAVCGGALGVLFTALAVRSLGPVLPESLFRVGTATLDARVLLFALCLTLITPLLFGLAPAIGSVRGDLTRALKEGSRRAGVGRGALRGRRALVVTQIALAAVIIASAGLMIRSFIAIERVDVGFEADRLLTIEVSAPASTYGDAAALNSYYERALAALDALPGTGTPATVSPLPLNHETPTTQVAPQDDATDPKTWPVVYNATVSPGYFAAMGMPLIAGRDFRAGDDGIIISRRLAEQQWPGEDPIGRTLLYDADTRTRGTVIGVVGDVRHDGLVGALTPHLYQSATAGRRRFIVLPVEGAIDPATLTRAAQEALLGVDPNVPATIRPYRDIVRESSFQWSVGSLALTAFGSTALLLAALGLYGIIAYSAAERSHELALRLAMGARASQIRSMILGEGLKLTGTGACIGLVLALLAARAFASQLVGVSATDPVTFGGVFLGLVALGVATTARVAIRAGATSPQRVLRDE